MENSNECVKRFGSTDCLLRYADLFVRGRIEQFSKDLAICLCPTLQMNSSANYHWETRVANFPALMYSVSFLELLSSLHDGNLRGNGLEKIKKYAPVFLDTKVYTDDALAVFYEGFRHKVAHATQPYAVFDTATASKESGLKNGNRRRITWKVSAKKQSVAISIDKLDSEGSHEVCPGWRVTWDHLCTVGLQELANDIAASALGERGYLQSLREDATLQENFAKCMVEFFPPGDD